MKYSIVLAATFAATGSAFPLFQWARDIPEAIEAYSNGKLHHHPSGNFATVPAAGQTSQGFPFAPSGTAPAGTAPVPTGIIPTGTGAPLPGVTGVWPPPVPGVSEVPSSFAGDETPNAQFPTETPAASATGVPVVPEPVESANPTFPDISIPVETPQSPIPTSVIDQEPPVVTGEPGLPGSDVPLYPTGGVPSFPAGTASAPIGTAPIGSAPLGTATGIPLPPATGVPIPPVSLPSFSIPSGVPSGVPTLGGSQPAVTDAPVPTNTEYLSPPIVATEASEAPLETFPSIVNDNPNINTVV